MGNGIKVMAREKSLYEHLKKLQKERNHPSAFDFCGAYSAIKTYLEDHVYPHEEIGAALKNDGLLTNHGKKHVDDVIHHIELLLHDDFSNLNLHETFVLLLATLLHDVGNISGRTEHEKKIAFVMKNSEDYKRLDTTVKVTTMRIAQAHGGRTKEGNKDTLSIVRREEGLGGEKVRPRAIAALLRLADELADNSGRANDDMERLEQIPELNLIYHKYSKCLQPVMVEGDSLKFHYSMTVSQALTKFMKDESGKMNEKYLYDEILDRLRKASCEVAYCVRHGGGLFHYEDLNVTIDICTNEESDVLITIPLRLKMAGYPRLDSDISVDHEASAQFATGDDLASELRKSFPAQC